MSRNENRISKVITALGVFGLMMGLSASRASAQITSFSNANYVGRYTCNDASLLDFFTAVIRDNPDGAGGYTDGTLIGSLEPFVDADGAPSGEFCVYTLQPGSSNYAIDTTGVGSETLAWAPAVTNNALCPGAFIDETAIALRNIINATGASIRVEFSSADLLGSLSAGHGTCVQ